MKKILMFIISFSLILQFPYLIKADSEDILPVKTFEEESEELKNSILDGSLKLTYELMGAKGDGVSNDFEAIKKTHDYANKLYLETGNMVTVYGIYSSSYYIGTGNGNEIIDVVTNVDWQGCTFIFDDFVDADEDGENDVSFRYPIFDVVSDMKANTGWCIDVEFSPNNSEYPQVFDTVINRQTTNVASFIEAVKNSNYYKQKKEIKKDFDDCRIWGAYIIDAKKRWIRKGLNQDQGNNTNEILLFNSSSGDLLTSVDFDYENLEMIRIFPIRNNGISIGNATIITRTNNKVYPSDKKENYTYRGIRTRYTGNVALHNINHIIEEEAHPFLSEYQADPYANLYYGVINLQSVGLVKLDSINLQAHRPSCRPNQPNAFEGTYDLSLENAAFIYLDNIGYGDYKKDMISSDRWGVVSSNRCKNVFLTNSSINRFDAHRGITNLYVSNTLFGTHGLTLIGQGTFYAEHIIFDQAVRPIQLRQDYGACWNGNMYFDDVSIALPYNSDPFSYTFLIYAFNTESWDFGYRSYFPNIYMKNINLSSSGKSRAIMLQICDTLRQSYNNASKDNLYYFKGDVMIQNITTDKNIEYMQVFVNEFQLDDFNLNRTNYGGDNRVTLDIDDKVTKNIGEYEDPKFVLGSIDVSYREPRNDLLVLFNMGIEKMNFDYNDIPVDSVDFEEQELNIEIGETRVLHLYSNPKISTSQLIFESLNESVVSVDNLGKVFANGVGSTSIIVKNKEGIEVGQCIINVNDAKAYRIYGADRYATSIMAAKFLLKIKNIEKFNNVIISTGKNYADALSGSYLANQLEAPIILIMNKKSVKNEVVNFINECLKEDGTIYILGGEAVVEESWLKGVTQKIKRISGDNRYITNIEILKEIGYQGGEILVCTANDFADSLSVSSVDIPVLLVGDSLRKVQKNYLEQFSGECTFYPIGGDKAVSNSVLEQLSKYGTVNNRIMGEDRYETSAAIAKKFRSNAKQVVLAYGKDFADGLSAGPLASALGAPLLLVDSTNKRSKYATKYCQENGIDNALVLGGAGLVYDMYVERICGLKEGYVPSTYE